MVFICVFCVFMLHLWGVFIWEKTPKTSGVIVVFSGIESIGNSLKIRNMWNIGKLKIFFALLLWCMTSETFLINLFQKLYPPLIFKRLSADSLLQGCQRRLTQSQNESLNNMVWACCQKRVPCDINRSQISVCEAVTTFNSGAYMC